MKKAQLDPVLFKIIGFIIIIFIGLFLLANVVGKIQDYADDPNRETGYYDVTCEFKLENPALGNVYITGDVSCYYTKTPLFFSVLDPDWFNDEGTMKMEAQNKVIWGTYRIQETGYVIPKLTIRKLLEGNTDIKITIFDELGKPLDYKQIDINIGE